MALVPGATSIGSGVASRTKSNVNADDVDEDVDVVDVAELVEEVDAVEEVEEVEEACEEDDVVEGLEEVEVVLEVDWDIDELLTVLVFELLACGEPPSVKYAPTAATAITTTTTPAKAALLTALRLSDEFEQTICVDVPGEEAL